MTSDTLSKMYKSTSKCGWKCVNRKGTFYHAWQTSEITKKYWMPICMIKQRIKKNIQVKPEFFLLELTDRKFKKLMDD